MSTLEPGDRFAQNFDAVYIKCDSNMTDRGNDDLVAILAPFASK